MPNPSAPPGPGVEVDWYGLGDAVLRRAAGLLRASAPALDAMNVFPVADADTGTNCTLTLEGLAARVPAITPTTLDDLTQAAVVSAHGNSGAILAQMVVSVARAIRPGVATADSGGGGLARLLRTAADGARVAVARPVVGTILTVADAAATGAETAAAECPAEALKVAQAAQTAAAAALRDTPRQLETLERAGVVDAGGQALVLLLDVLVDVLGGAPAVALTATDACAPRPAATARPAPDYEVMYALRGAAGESLDGLRRELSALGHSVVVVGDQAVAQVHVHLVDPGAAIEAGLPYGRPSQIRVTALRPEHAAPTRTVVSVVAGAGLADAVMSLGAHAITASGPAGLAELERVIGQTGGDVIILPNDLESLEGATHLAGRLRADRAGRIAVIPTVAQVQGLAAIAVHEPSSDFDTTVVAMSSAAGHARHGAVTIAESAAMTMAGRCEPGDVLGVVEGDFVERGDDLTDVAWRVVQRLTAAGGELLTLVTGAGADAGLAEELRRRAQRAGSGLDVEVVVGGQSRYPLLVGLE